MSIKENLSKSDNRRLAEAQAFLEEALVLLARADLRIPGEVVLDDSGDNRQSQYIEKAILYVQAAYEDVTTDLATNNAAFTRTEAEILIGDE